MDNIVLLGDSIFDNAAYVPGGDPMIEQLRSRLTREDRATLLASDGAVISSLIRQLNKLPEDSTHLIISIGGNNALESSHVLRNDGRSAGEVLAELSSIQRLFADEYRQMLRTIQGLRKRTVICTIYDSIPDLQSEEVLGLSVFNDAIVRAGVSAGLPILDLRLICNELSDYSTVSPIEPSERGGSKIARAIVRVVKGHDFSRSESIIYR